jgi:hypothetical protein
MIYHLIDIFCQKTTTSFKDGDILYSINNSNVMTKSLVPSSYNHVNIIIKKNNVLYVVESSKIGLLKTGNTVSIEKLDIHMNTLSDQLKYSLNTIHICRLNKPLDDYRKTIITYIM